MFDIENELLFSFQKLKKKILNIKQLKIKKKKNYGFTSQQSINNRQTEMKGGRGGGGTNMLQTMN